jgi:hypothetical protein
VDEALLSRLAQEWHGLLRRRQFYFIDVTPSPPFARLERRDHRMARVMEMPRGVLTWRAIATADVTTIQAEPKMNPSHAEPQALFATI